MKDDRAIAAMKGKRKITHHGGTLHGSWIMAMAETFHGGAE